MQLLTRDFSAVSVKVTFKSLVAYYYAYCPPLRLPSWPSNRRIDPSTSSTPTVKASGGYISIVIIQIRFGREHLVIVWGHGHALEVICPYSFSEWWILFTFCFDDNDSFFHEEHFQ
jgi:hypothetical protein